MDDLDDLEDMLNDMEGGSDDDLDDLLNEFAPSFKPQPIRQKRDLRSNDVNM
jgi:hypothetical protein